MKNAEKIINALREVFPGHAVEYQYKAYQNVYSVFLDRDTYIGSFNPDFFDKDDNPEIEMTIKAPLKDIEKFIADNYINYYNECVREAVERGLKEWQEGSQASN